MSTWFDSASTVPALVEVGGTSLLDLPGGVLAIGDAWTQPGWRSARATDAADPWAVLAAANDLRLPSGVALTGTGGLSVGGLEWLGARVYDPAARGFLSVDPLAPIVGAAWAGNPYSYAGNDPLQALDPLGLRPRRTKTCRRTGTRIRVCCRAPVSGSATIKMRSSRRLRSLRESD